MGKKKGKNDVVVAHLAYRRTVSLMEAADLVPALEAEGYGAPDDFMLEPVEVYGETLYDLYVAPHVVEDAVARQGVQGD